MTAMRDPVARKGSGGIGAVANPVLAWLQAEGVRYRETLPFVEALAERLLATGVDLIRLTTGIHILHPQIDASSCLWQRDRPVTERRFKLNREGTQQFQNSPMPIVYGGQPVRKRLDGSPEEGEFPIFADLRNDGATDYLALPLPFSDGSSKAVTFVTARPGGFPDGHVALLADLVPTLAMILEIQTLQRTTLTLLDAYVGPTAGRRVLEGAIKRGMCEPIQAVIWFSDLRSFTELSESLPGVELLQLLNDYFGVMTEMVGRHGGEVLKFIGDGLLAIFPLQGGEGSAVAERALIAAQEAETGIRAQNEERSQAGAPLIRFGLALHVGQVLYGNIGGEGRLDFTVIGPAVNLATRIESLCRTLDRQMLVSGDFAALCNTTLEPLGSFQLKGVGTSHPVFGVPNKTQDLTASVIAEEARS
jgi:adenylate cyclase